MADEDSIPTLVEGELIQNRFICEKKLGEGGFGAVYRVKDSVNEQLYAMKVESIRESNKWQQVLKMEIAVLKDLKKLGGRHACTMISRGRILHSQLSYVVMTLLGQSLSDLRRAMPQRCFSLGTALRCSIQCLEGIEDLHRIGYLHRDIKPGNFAIGREEKQQHRTVFVLDFGLSRRYINDEGHIRTPRVAAGFRGTVRYAPLSCHKSRELSRKDDLETWFYQLVELTRGYLPWYNLTEKGAVGLMKEAARESGELYTGCPKQYQHILIYIDSLKYWFQPDYDRIYGNLRQCMQQIRCRDNDPYDWEKNGKGYQQTSRLPPARFHPHQDAPFIN